MEEPVLKPRNKWLAALLSCIAPGLGQLYCGRGRRAFWFLAAYFGILAGSAGLAFFLDDLRPAFAFSFTLLVLTLVCIIDVWRLARRTGAIKPRQFNKWYIYVAFWAFSYLALQIPVPFMEAFHIPARSMQPNLMVGDHLQAKKNPFDTKVPERGTITLFWQPSNPENAYIKRLIGLPGDRVQYRAGRLFLNGNVVQRALVETPKEGRIYRETLPGGGSYLIQEKSENTSMDDTKEYVVPEGHLFFLGDNRDQSHDSRFLEAVGYVPFENIIGTANFIYWSKDMSRIGSLIQ